MGSFWQLDGPTRYKLVTYKKGLASGGARCPLREVTMLNLCNLMVFDPLNRLTSPIPNPVGSIRMAS